MERTPRRRQASRSTRGSVSGSSDIRGPPGGPQRPERLAARDRRTPSEPAAAPLTAPATISSPSTNSTTPPSASVAIWARSVTTCITPSVSNVVALISLCVSTTKCRRAISLRGCPDSIPILFGGPAASLEWVGSAQPTHGQRASGRAAGAPPGSAWTTIVRVVPDGSGWARALSRGGHGGPGLCPRDPLSDRHTGCGAAWLARLTGGQEVPGSNPGSPTHILPSRQPYPRDGPARPAPRCSRNAHDSASTAPRQRLDSASIITIRPHD